MLHLRWFSLGLAALASAALGLVACGTPFTTSTGTTGTGGTASTSTSSSGSVGGQGAGGLGGSSSVGTGTGGKGGGATGECTVPSECPGVDTECRKRTCVAGICGSNQPSDATASQIYGDCLARVCDGAGSVVTVADATDKYDDGKSCTTDGCKGGSPENKVSPGILCGDGNVCDETGACVECTKEGKACLALMECDRGICVPMHCVDGLKNFLETDVDCGSEACRPCQDGHNCIGGNDCMSNVCMGNPKACKPPSCIDGWKNGTETDVDCGGKCAEQDVRCGSNNKCVGHNDCLSNVCKAGICQAPSCVDGKQNGTESGPDCGGGGCAACAPAN